MRRMPQGRKARRKGEANAPVPITEGIPRITDGGISEVTDASSLYPHASSAQGGQHEKSLALMDGLNRSLAAIETPDDAVRVTREAWAIQAALKELGVENFKYNNAGVVALRSVARLGEMLDPDLKRQGSPKNSKGGSSLPLPEGVSWNLSSFSKRWSLLGEDARQRFYERYIDEETVEPRETVSYAAALEYWRESDRARKLAEFEAYVLPEDSADVVLGDFREVGSRVADESCDLVFTDPPYGRDFLPLYDDLARFSARVLVPGGALIAYAPQYTLMESAALMSKHLTYWWTLACVHGGSMAMMREWGIRVSWKPMLMFTKGRWKRDHPIADVASGGKEKDDRHPWGQAEGEAAYYIEHMTELGGLVVDPFCGGGTTAVAAARMKRRIWTCDVMPVAVQKTIERLRGLE